MKPQSMLFTIFGEYVRHYGGEIWVGSLSKLLKEFGMTEQAVRAAISRMSKQGWLVSRKMGNRGYYSMSEYGKKHLDEAAERIYKVEPGPWNGKWCMISYNIPEEQRNLRDQLRKEISYMGFGTLSNSTWITPNDLADRIKQLTERLELTPYVEIFTAEHLGWSDSKQLVQKCWNLEEINQAYKAFIESFEPHYKQFVEKMNNNDGIEDSYCFVEKTELVHYYRKFLFIDPDLPQELLPEVWLGHEADLLFQNFYNLLHPGAVRFFEEAYEKILTKS
ncbi:phenylacetic acid degradation operon negative regulatory protein PaaX [Paenibacillus sp. MZ04-78.2]|uniref:phenylacetic acid degradation operon negative regulatory protein PaaX n=1 Tax=Paenibacillus sp. MZ04-78.2 TaxID=2962034 RepID=UPI0020B8B444|nr:phenylacetic acid degradation operon negative regulatory protein PaaX [Paenibacillus sp. MZ04-78.2]MCP3772774.1 phenylacetic acid degradation operon negative regulatory protein PaaX [Paenibacillus sp. MZ04-78.2]